MTQIKIEKNDCLRVNNYFLEVDLLLKDGEVLRLDGENGAGKSTLLQYLKKNQDQFFKDEDCQFLDQIRLSPLNQVSFNDLKNLLVNYRYESLDIYHDFENCIEKYLFIPINQLSGGQNQMVKLALALYLGGKVFLLDEPFQFLDKENQTWVMKMIKELKNREKKILVIEHQVNISNIVDSTSVIRMIN